MEFNPSKENRPLRAVPGGKAVDSQVRNILLHFHIFKNAGSTVDAALEKNFGPTLRYVENSDPDQPLVWSDTVREIENDPNIRALSSHTARFPAPPSSEFHFIPIFLIRHPIDRLASIYYFKRKSTDQGNTAVRVAQTGTIADFMRFALARNVEIPSAVCDAQTSWLARGGKYDSPPSSTDLEKAKSIVAAAKIPGVVERIDEYLVGLEETLSPSFPGLDFAVKAKNRNPARSPSLLSRLRQIRAALPAALWRELHDRNRLDLELWRFTYRLAKTRFLQMPNASKSLTQFNQRKALADPTDLPWTGERLVASAKGDFVAEHLHRYALATEFAQGLDVLDVACGEGYGSNFLARVARSVVGVDCDSITVNHAAKKYQAANLRFAHGQAEKLPLPAHSIDLVVSFETLEHLENHDAMLQEIKRVLRPGGRLCISTPDSRPYRAVSGQINPFHVRELDLQQFELLLSRNFRNVKIAYQKSLTGSWIAPFISQTEAPVEYAGTFTQVEKLQPGTDAPYLVALASDATVPVLSASVFNSEQEVLAQIATLTQERDAARKSLSELQTEFEKRTVWATSLDAELQKARDVLAAQANLTDERTKWAKSLEQDLNSTRERFDQLTREFAERTVWATSLNRDLEKARDALTIQANLTDERTRWAKSLEQDLNSTRERFDQLTREFAERSAWTVSLDTELLKTKNAFQEYKDQTDVTVKNLTILNGNLESRLSAIRKTCLSLAVLLPGCFEKDEIPFLELAARKLAELQRDFLAKDQQCNLSAGLVMDAGARAEIAETEVQRLTQSIEEAQVHVDGLLRHTANLQARLNTQEAAKIETDSLLRESQSQLGIFAVDLQVTRRELERYQTRLLCRMFARRPAANTIHHPTSQ